MITRRIASDEDVARFEKSETYADVVNFILALNEAARGREIGEVEPVSAPIATLRTILGRVDELVKEHPAAPSKSRFGKPEYVDFYDALKAQAPAWFSPLTSNREVAEYFAEGFGNRQRIDYGSGHELNFMCSLLCLRKLGVLTSADDANLVLNVFAHYLRTMRTVQQTYWLEPAGSHGVWGLDDYHFLPYLFGSGQLVDERGVRPIDIHDEGIVDMYQDTNFYFWSIAFINRVKTASLRWHSPMLDDISGVKRWAKVNEGMIKMYKAEVLGKLPVIQHFLFGDILPAAEGTTPPGAVGNEVHLHCWADCCGIRVPSAVAASEASQGHSLRRSEAVPVD